MKSRANRISGMIISLAIGFKRTYPVPLQCTVPDDEENVNVTWTSGGPILVLYEKQKSFEGGHMKLKENEIHSMISEC